MSVETILIKGMMFFALMSVLSLAGALYVYYKKISVNQLFLTLIIFCIPLLSAISFSSSSKTIFPVNLCLADVFVFLSTGYLLFCKLHLKQSIKLPLFWLFWIYILWIMLSLYVGIYQYSLALFKVSNFMQLVKICVLVTYFYVILNLIKTREDVCLCIDAWLISAALQALFGICGTIFSIVFHIDNLFVGNSRAIGTFGNPNMFSGHIQISIFITFAYLALHRHRIVGLFYLILFFLALILTASKGGLLSFIAGLTVFVLLVPEYRFKAMAAFSCLFIVLSASYFTGESTSFYAKRLILSKDTISSSSYVRFEMWSDALDVWKDNMIFGVGKGNLGKINIEMTSHAGKSKMKGQEAKTKETIVPHSTYVSLLSETGIVGLILFMGIVSVFIVRIFNHLITYDSNTEIYRVMAAFLAALTGSLVQGIVANVEESRGLWVLLGLIFATSNKIMATYSSKEISHGS